MKTKICELCLKPYEYRVKQQRFCSHRCRDEYNDGVPAPRPLSNSLRFAIFSRDGFRCVYCGSEEKLQIDHLQPISAGGRRTDPQNMVTACRECNLGKGDNELPPDLLIEIQNRISRRGDI